MSAGDLQRRMAAHPKNLWIPLTEIHSARLRKGILNSRLQVELSSGDWVKLLWLKHDPAFDVLSQLLGERLGPSLSLR